MNKVKYSNLTRILAFFLQEILVMTTIALAFYLSNTITSMDYLKEAVNGKDYLESQDFREQLIAKINDANYFMKCQNDFEVEGEYDGNKEVTIGQFLDDTSDVSEYCRQQKYKLQDLVDWSEEGIETSTLFELLKEKICSTGTQSKTDYTRNLEMIEGLAESDQITFVFELLQNEGYLFTEDMVNISMMKEYYKSIQKWTLLDYCLDKKDFSEIEKSSMEIQEVLYNIHEEYNFYKKYEAYFTSMDSSNFKIYIQNDKEETILNNCINDSTNFEEFFNSKVSGGVIYNAVNNEFAFTDYINDDVYSNVDIFKIPDQVNYIYAVGIDGKYAHDDEFLKGYQTYSNNRYSIIIIILSLIVILFCFIYLVAVCGRSPKDEEIHLNGFDKIKTEIGAGIMIALGIIVIVVIEGTIYSSIMDYRISVIFGMDAETALFTLGFLSLAKRIKARQLWKNSLFYAMLESTKMFLQYRKVTTRVVIMYFAFLVIHLGLFGITIRIGSFLVLVLWFAFTSMVGLLLLKEAVARQKIMNGIEKITGGDLQFKIDTASISGSNEILANAVNNIGEGLHNAVDASIRNERLKTDLITNVSHDIKTPLTSIINYVDLIKRENIEDKKIKGYIDILDKKSQRLKNLTEDLVEASKISSGNIKLEMSKINFLELINQTEGEFSEKFEAKELQVIKTLPIDIDTVLIYADGRRIWRVVENLYNNVAKYAMENTRVYVDVKANQDNVIFSIKNISEYPLNINADELTERFIRGDVSRSTEGSGLGLSIAKNLTTLQKGTFEIYLDGDLFRVTITFPRVD